MPESQKPAEKRTFIDTLRAMLPGGLLRDATDHMKDATKGTVKRAPGRVKPAPKKEKASLGALRSHLG